jgi:acyl-CoA synthetase (AMP-forming)/AMP-acid ligase II
VEQFVHRFLESSARKYPDKTAVFHGSSTSTYGKINSLSNRLASILLRNGIKKGDRVLLVMENSIEGISCYYGILKAGGVCVEIHDRSTLAEASYYIKNSGSRICILSGASMKRMEGIDIPVIISSAPPGSCSGTYVPWDEIETMPDDNPDVPLHENDLAAIVYTSGSTGKPKGVMLSHRNICSNTFSIVGYLGLTESDRVMAVLPFYYVYGKSLLNTHFLAGGSLVINNRFIFPNAVIQEMVQKEVTGFAGVPSTYALLMNRSIFPKTDLPNLRYMTQAGGAMAPALINRVLKCLKGAKFYVMYGATEASARLTYLPPERLNRKRLGSIGIPIPGVEITIRDDEGHELKSFEVGNICAQGPNIMRGYWEDPEETGKVLKPWGLVTGDLGHKDREGFIYLTGRKKEMLKIGGERVSPKEIEDAIIESGIIHEVKVLGRPDAILSEVPTAFLVPLDPDNFELSALVHFLSERLSAHKIPRFWYSLRSLPKKPSGKIDKEALDHEALHEMRIA